MTPEEIAERRRVWLRDLLAVGSRSPDGNGSVSSGVFHSWLELGKHLMKHGAADEKFLVDSLYLLGRELESNS